jgi:hypothetical protein
LVEHGLCDHLVRPRQHRLRDRQAKCLGGLEIDDEFELSGLLDGEITGLAALVTLAMLASPMESTLAAPQPQPVDTGTESEPFQVNDDIEDVVGASAQLTLNVPAGRVLVVEFISVRVTTPEGQVSGVVVFQGGAGFGTAIHHLVFHAQTPGVFTAAHPMKSFVAGGVATINFAVSRTSSTGFLTLAVSVSGHLRR